MSFLKSKMNLLGTTVVAASLSFMPVIASATPQDEMAAPQGSVGFAGSDLNADGVLDMSEFTLYAGDQAVAGDADYTAVVSSGDYETAFRLLDADGNGSLSAEEVSGESDGIDEDIAPESETDTESEY